LIALAMILLGLLLAELITPAFGRPVPGSSSPAASSDRAGLLLLLQLSCLCLLNTYRWVGEPMRRANLGSIMKLQRCVTPQGIIDRLETWRQFLACRWSEADRDPQTGPAGRALRAILREALWRDIFGFVPIYNLVLGFGLWYAAIELDWQWLNRSFLGLPLWFFLPLVTLFADYFEDCCHLRYLALHKRGARPAALLPLVSATASLLKFAFLTFAIPVTLWSVTAGSLRVAVLGRATGWRGMLVLILSVAAALLVVLLVIGVIVNRVARWKKGKDLLVVRGGDSETKDDK
jgi:putative effector of murein hydrolase LrgA (UPF0299 family)